MTNYAITAFLSALVFAGLLSAQQSVTVISSGTAMLPTSSATQTSNALITPADRALFNAKQPLLTFTPENGANKNAKNGYAGLDLNGLFPWTQISGVPTASATTFGCLKPSDFALFQSKQNALGFTPENFANKNAKGGYLGLDVNGQINWSVVSHVPTASATLGGILSHFDWITFNGKQDALGFTAENTANKNAKNGYAGLDANAQFPYTQLSGAPVIPAPLGYTPENLANKNQPGGYAGLDGQARFPYTQLSGAPAIPPALGYTAENTATKDQPNGYPSLDPNGLVPLKELPVSAGGTPPTQVFNEWYQVPATQSTPGSFALANSNVLASSIVAYINGLRMTPTIDFSVSGNVVSFVPHQTPNPGDILVFDYQHN